MDLEHCRTFDGCVGGINQGIIVPEAYSRGIAAMGNLSAKILMHKTDKVFAFGTSALRDASNGALFITEVKNRFNIDVTLITGDKEAELIYLGVKQTIGLVNEKFIILDIGGGSNEFIIADKQRFYWKESFKLGMARLIEKFNPPDPITTETIEFLESYFEDTLGSLIQAIEVYSPSILIGASGSFDSFVSMIHSDIFPNDFSLPASQPIELAEFENLHTQLIQSTREERDKMNGLEPVRRDMIVLAAVFVNYIMKRFKISTLHQSSYALKEGALWEIMQTDLGNN